MTENHALDSVVEANPRRPYKLYAGMISAGISSFVASGVDLNPYVEAGAVSLVAAIAVFLTPNPLRTKIKDTGTGTDALYLGE